MPADGHKKEAAVLLGATGLVGRELAARLAGSGRYRRVISLQRREVDELPGGIEQTVVDLADEAGFPDPGRVDDVFCAIGSTIKKAGSKEAFEKVDYAIPMRVAKWAAEKGAKRFYLVSSNGASPDSAAFYTRVKGRLERDLAGLGYESVTAFRPSFLDGGREESRPGERLGIMAVKALKPLLSGPFRKFRATPVPRLVDAILDHAGRDGSARGLVIVENDKIVD